MSKTVSPGVGSELSNLARMLARLTRKGARLVARPDRSNSFDVVVPGGLQRRGVEPSPTFAAAEVTIALARGWIAPDATVGGWTLTEAGALARHTEPLDAGRPMAALVSQNVAASRDTAAATVAILQRLRQRRGEAGRPILSSVQVEAGERLARDFLIGEMMPRVTANWSAAALGAAKPGAGSGRGAELRDGAADAQERVRRALEAVGSELSGILIDVCCLERGLEVVEAERHWSRGTGRTVLQIALDMLGRHYGMVATGPARGRMGHWGAENYRPNVT